ncbi:MAG: C40 family peptidase [Elusimicrobia bacterium]|nr:C40 family peptidase [Elusimicrobiota bacterium]
MDGFRRRWLALAAAAAFGVAGCAGRAPAKRVDLPVPPKAKAVVRTAKTYLSEEEKHRKQPRDCSDYVGRVFSENGISMPRTSVEMSTLGERISSSRELRMGDLVFFSGSNKSRIVGHVGIYINKGIFIHFSNEQSGVTQDSLYSDYYRTRYLTARRVIP